MAVPLRDIFFLHQITFKISRLSIRRHGSRLNPKRQHFFILLLLNAIPMQAMKAAHIAGLLA
jgi:hypothetical protein